MQMCVTATYAYARVSSCWHAHTPPRRSLHLHGIVGFVALMCLHALCYFLVTTVLSDSSRFAELKSDPTLAAHVLPQFVAFAVAAYLGATFWFYGMPKASTVSIGSYVPQGEIIASMMISFQLYELLMCIPSRVRAPAAFSDFFSCAIAHGTPLAEPPVAFLRRQKLRGPSYEFLMHHATALLLAVLAYYYQAFLYFAPGFMGVP